MAKSKLIPAYFKWRDGRPRWEPGPGLRARGWSGRDLKDDAGEWLGMGEAIAAAHALNAQVTIAGGNRPLRRKAEAAARSCNALFARFWQCADFARLASKTRADYRSKGTIFLEDGFGPAPVFTVRKPHAIGWWEKTYAKRGHAMANGTLAVVRRVFSYGELIGWLPAGSNPFNGLKRPTIEPRCVVFTPREIELLVATADAGDMARDGFGPSTGDAIVIALHTGQRQADVIALRRDRTENGRVRLKQGKTGARVSVPISEPLAARMADIERRRRAQAVASFATADILVINERTGQPYTGDQVRKAFAKLRARASRTLPSVADKLFLDLRDTAVTRLALAGATVPEIRAVTGHSMTSITQVLVHYLALDDRMADAAIERLRDWMADEGIAL